MTLEPFQERVLAERQELDERRYKLNVFILSQVFASLDSHDRSLLREQALAMTAYSEALAARIERFSE